MQCMLIHEDGTWEARRASQREAHEVLGGPVTLVGALDDLGIFAARRDAADAPINRACGDPTRFDVPVRGPCCSWRPGRTARSATSTSRAPRPTGGALKKLARATGHGRVWP